jgi:hypothetical protein
MTVQRQRGDMNLDLSGSQIFMKDARYTGKKNLAVLLQSGLHPSELL